MLMTLPSFLSFPALFGEHNAREQCPGIPMANYKILFFRRREIVLSVSKNLKQIKNTTFVRYEVIEYVSAETAVAALIKKF